jgi:hypothetical protein
MRFDYLTTNQESTFVNACLRKFLVVSASDDCNITITGSGFGANGDECWELDAVPPDTLAQW